MKIEEHNKLSKLNGKLITLDVQIFCTLDDRSFEFVKKQNLDVQIVRIC